MMFNKISLITALLLFLLGTNVFAHSHLEDSSPKDGAVLTESLKEIKLTFETNLEPTSTFTLADANGTAVTLPVEIKGNQLVGVLQKDLANGAYSIHWKIIGTDGHPLEGDLSFTVKLPEESSTTAQTESTDSSTQKEQTADTGLKNSDSSSKSTEDKETAAVTTTATTAEPSFKDYVIPASVALIIFVGLGSYWLIFRRKHT
ncbi:methionine-rich copper-binding protein CopC [Bacillus sp. SORGH_AS 510]|uniref:copper resistance CopC family protein n=1 Tax=Bacillus sp. SORGH_AS_0510 TaxID=3041771 RepID=UPI00277D737F|nr:copper resistance CopC family protein [Bacillus sp. SORGH_AS_0510]MDQ1147466.1 methionine-rich copper-binding protein CopC [Bacillus sp. SORGH_AS_0510]